MKCAPDTLVAGDSDDIESSAGLSQSDGEDHQSESENIQPLAFLL